MSYVLALYCSNLITYIEVILRVHKLLISTNCEVHTYLSTLVVFPTECNKLPEEI